MPLQKLIGTQAFLPALLAHIREEITSSAVPLDHVIFQSILLCLIAGDKHLILRTPEEDIAITVKLAVWTLSCIFDMPTRKLKIRPRNAATRPGANSASDPVTLFLRSIFIPTSSSESNSNYTSPNEDDEGSLNETVTETSKQTGKKRHRTPKHAASTNSIKSPRPGLPELKPRSYPGNATNPPILRTTSPESILMQGSSYEGTSTGILKPTPVYPANYPPIQGMKHAFTDPLPLGPRRVRKGHHGSRSSAFSKQLLQLPKALVLSGLEQGNESVQRALAQIIREKKINLSRGTGDDDENVWPLADDFIVIYVCPWNAKERPAIHKTLLDKFAMSTNIFISQAVRRDFTMMSLWPPGASKPPHANDPFSQSNPSSPSPGYPMSLSQSQTYTPPVLNKPLPTHRPHPSASASTYHSGPSLLPPKPATPPVPPSLLKALRDAHTRVNFSSNLLLYLSDVISATRHNSRLDGMLLTATAMRDAQALIKASRVIGSDLTGGELLRPSAAAAAATADTDGASTIASTAMSDAALYAAAGADGDAGPEDEDQIFQDARSTFDMGEERQGLLEGGTAGGAAGGAAASARDRERAGAAAMHRVLDVSEVDVARIVPRVVSHRLRVRDGPENEILSSALFGATFRPPARMLAGDAAQQAEHEKPVSVKNLLVHILAEV